MWCRVCGSKETSRWRPSPWGTKKLCNAHWNQWTAKKIQLPPVEPTKPMFPGGNSYSKRRKKRRVTEQSLRTHPELLHTFQQNVHIHTVMQRIKTLNIHDMHETLLSLRDENLHKVDKMETMHKNLCRYVETMATFQNHHHLSSLEVMLT